jgi:hypothetical protein
MDECRAIHRDYLALLGEWDIPVDGLIPIARSNVAPLGQPQPEILLYGFSYTVPSPGAPPSFFISASPEKGDVRPGESTPDALQEKMASAMQSMQTGLAALEMDWAAVTGLSIYTHHDVHAFFEQGIIATMGPSAVHGIHWYFGPPPIIGIEVEIDVRAIRQEIRC